jgi:hypothetical protein
MIDIGISSPQRKFEQSISTFSLAIHYLLFTILPPGQTSERAVNGARWRQIPAQIPARYQRADGTIPHQVAPCL